MQAAAIPFLRVLVYVALGIGCRWARVIDREGANHFSRWIFGLALPCMLFTSAYTADFASLRGPAVFSFLAGVALPVVLFGLSHLLARAGRFSAAQRQVIRVCAAFPNTAFFGIPLCASFFGPMGGLLAGIFDQGVTLPYFILGPLSFSARPHWRAVLKQVFNPMLAALAAGLALRAAHWALPEVVMGPLEAIGATAGPLALVLMGALIDLPGMRRARWRPLAALTVGRLALAPALAALCLLPFSLEPLLFQTLVLQAAMPTSLVGVMMAFEYGSDHELAVQGSLATLAVGLFTIPTLVFLLRAF